MKAAPPLVGLLALLVAAPAAGAHTLLTSPTPRSQSDGLKTGPCGGVARTDSPMVIAPGSVITVDWLETIDHPGYYRIALSMGGDQGFDDNVLADRIADERCEATPCDYREDVTLPDTECLDCTLQLIQYMGQPPEGPFSPYFSCADLMITNDAPDPGDGDGDPEPSGSADGGCQASRAAGHGAWSTLLLLCLVLGLSRQDRGR